MEFERNHIDAIFNRRLRDAEVTPPAFVWPGVERALRRRKRRRFLVWLFACGMAGAGLWAMMSRHDTGQRVVAVQQVFSDNHKETKTELKTEIQASSVAASGQKNEPSKGTLAAAPATSPRALIISGKKTAVKGERALLRSVAVLEPPKGSETKRLVFNEKDVQIALTVPERNAIAGLSPLDNRLPSLPAFSRQTVLPKVKSFIRKKKDPKYCYDFAQDPNVWLLDAYAGPTFSKRSFEAKNPASEPYRQQRLATERGDWAFNAGLRASLLFGRHYLLRTGLHYEQTNEVFEYFDPNYVKYIVEITQTVIDNKPVTIIDTVGVEYGENYVKTYNRYGLLDIPLEAGAEIRSGRFGLSIHAGISLNVLFWKRGNILTAAGPTPFTPGEKGATEVFRTRAGLSAGAGAQLFFHLQPRLRVFAEPYVRQVLKPLTLDDQPVEQRFRTLGIKLGLTKILD